MAAAGPAAIAGLTAVVDELTRAGLSFTFAEQPATSAQVVEKCLRGSTHLTVSGCDMRSESYSVESLADLATLDALYVTHDLQSLGNPALGGALHHMSCLGLRLFKSMGGGAQWVFKYEYTGRGNQLVDMGRYGAYQMFQGGGRDPRPSQPLLVGFGEESEDRKPFRVAIPLYSSTDVVRTAWFQFASREASLDENPFARTLRDLYHEGYTFNKPRSDRLRPGDLLDMPADAPVGVGVWGCHVETLPVGSLRDFRPQPSTVDALHVVSETFAQEVRDFEFTGDDIREVMRFCSEPGPLQDRPELWHLLHEMAQTHPTFPKLHATRAAMADVKYLLEQPGAGTDAWWKLDVPLFRGITGQLPAERLHAVFPALKGLVEEATDPQQAELVRNFLVALISSDARAVHEAAAHDLAGSPLVRVLDHALAQQDALQARSTDPTLGERALRDYLAVSDHALPGQSLDDAAAFLREVHDLLARPVGCEASRDTFAFIQEGVRDGRLHGRSATEALAEIVAAFCTGRDIVDARDAVLVPRVDASNGGAIKTDDNCVTIGGVRVPVRHFLARPNPDHHVDRAGPHVGAGVASLN